MFILNLPSIPISSVLYAKLRLVEEELKFSLIILYEEWLFEYSILLQLIGFQNT